MSYGYVSVWWIQIGCNDILNPRSELMKLIITYFHISMAGRYMDIITINSFMERKHNILLLVLDETFM